MKQLEKFFNNPAIYNVIQYVLAWTGGRTIFRKLQEYINPGIGDKILDVGCGTGKYTQIFQNFDYTGIDINENYLDYACKRYPFGKFMNMDATRLDFPDNNFKFVFSVSTFHHLSVAQIEKAVEEMKRVCANNGVVYIVDNVFPRKINFIGFLLFKLDRGSYQRNYEAMEKLLSRFGFEAMDPKLKRTFPYRYAIFRYRKKS